MDLQFAKSILVWARKPAYMCPRSRISGIRARNKGKTCLRTIVSPSWRKTSRFVEPSGWGVLAPTPDYGPLRKVSGSGRLSGADGFAPDWRKRWDERVGRLRLSLWHRRAASAALWFPEGTIKRRGQRRRRLQPPTGTRKGSCQEPFLVPGAGAAISVAIVSCQFLFKVLTDRMLGSDSVG